jgi:HAD superfamily hydrolase (TIGR01509 family)
MIKGFFFDLDDTLVGTKEANFLAYRDAFLSIGEKLPYDVFSRNWGKDSQQFIREEFPHLSKESTEKIRENKSTMYENYFDKTLPNEVLILLLGTLSEHYPTVLVTTAKTKNARAILSRHGLEQYFTHLVFGDDVINGKPDPEPYLKALELTGLKPHEAIAFEDSENGVRSAETAGIMVIKVNNFAE